jgi:hypothetical protein
MCQNWYAIVGNGFEVVGFLIIAFEWYHQFKRDYERRLDKLQTAYERQSAEILGRPYEDPDNDKDNWRMFQKLFREGMNWRLKVYYSGLLVSEAWRSVPV